MRGTLALPSWWAEGCAYQRCWASRGLRREEKGGRIIALLARVGDLLAGTHGSSRMLDDFCTVGTSHGTCP